MATMSDTRYRPKKLTKMESITHRLKDERVIGGYLMLLPSVIIFAVFIIFPLLKSLYLSFTDTSLLYSQSAWVGLENFRTMIADPRFINAFTVTFKYTLGVVPGVIAVSLLLALVLDSNIRGKSFLPGCILPAQYRLNGGYFPHLGIHTRQGSRTCFALFESNRLGANCLDAQYGLGVASLDCRFHLEKRWILHGYLSGWPSRGA